MIKAFYFMILAMLRALKCQYVLNLLLKSIKGPKYRWSKFNYQSIRKKLKLITLFIKLHSKIYLFIISSYDVYLYTKLFKSFTRLKILITKADYKKKM
jgi:hypothetical protein